MYNKGFLFDFAFIHAFLTPVISIFMVSFSIETIFPLSPSVKTLISDDVKFYCQKLKIGYSMFSSQEIGPSLVSFQMIFEALQSELFENPKNPGIQPKHVKKLRKSVL